MQTEYIMWIVKTATKISQNLIEDQAWLVYLPIFALCSGVKCMYLRFWPSALFHSSSKTLSIAVLTSSVRTSPRHVSLLLDRDYRTWRDLPLLNWTLSANCVWHMYLKHFIALFKGKENFFNVSAKWFTKFTFNKITALISGITVKYPCQLTHLPWTTMGLFPVLLCITNTCSMTSMMARGEVHRHSGVQHDIWIWVPLCTWPDCKIKDRRWTRW